MGQGGQPLGVEPAAAAPDAGGVDAEWASGRADSGPHGPAEASGTGAAAIAAANPAPEGPEADDLWAASSGRAEPRPGLDQRLHPAAPWSSAESSSADMEGDEGSWRQEPPWDVFSWGMLPPALLARLPPAALSAARW